MELSDNIKTLIASRLFAKTGFPEEKKMKNATAKATEEKEKNLTVSETGQVVEDTPFVKVEKNLASIGFFTSSSKRKKNLQTKTIKFEKSIEGKQVKAEVTIIPSVLGLPMTADQDKYMAFMKIIEEIKKENGVVENPIAFSSAELIRIQGKKKNNKKYQEIDEWLDLMSGTLIKSKGMVYFAGEERWATDRFHVFESSKSRGAVLSSGEVADKNYVWLSEWQLQNINNNHLLPIDHETYKSLTNNISKAILPHLQIWLYASQQRGSCEKSYSSLCELLGLREYKYLSKIKEKLGPSLDELKTFGYLKSWRITRTADKKNFKIILRHGDKFYTDQVKRLNNKNKNGKAENASESDEEDVNRPKTPKEETKGSEAANFASEDKLVSVEEQQMLDSVTESHRELIKGLMVDYQIQFNKAYSLVTKNFEETEKQLKAFPFREIETKNTAGFLIKAIEKSYSLPDAYLEHQKQKERELELKRKKQIILDCSMCDDTGYRNIQSEMDTFYGVMHECSHNAEIEKEYEEHKI